MHMRAILQKLTRFLVAGVTCVTAVTPALHAQDPEPTPAVDSLRQRLEDLESLVQMLREQLATESETAVRTSSRVGFALRGQVLVNALYTSAATNNADVPLFVSPAIANERPGGSTLSMRQTMLGFAVSARDILGADFTGDLDVDFFGGQFPSTGGRHFPVMRLRTARAALAWARVTLMAGQDDPLITDVNPVSLASIGTPGFTAAGNLWLWLPQIRATYETRGALRLGLQGAVLAPVASAPATAFNTGFDGAERSRRPSLQARISARWGEEESAGEIGIGVHRGRVLTQADSVELTSEAVALSAVVPIGRFIELRGEAFDGQLLSGLGGGGIGQAISDAGTAVRGRGGWAQLNLRPNARWTVGAGVGLDEPERADVPTATGRRRNAMQALHTQWTPAEPVIVGLEWRRIATDYAAGMRRADHLNLALGFTF
jgi:hypothetical protein